MKFLAQRNLKLVLTQKRMLQRNSSTSSRSTTTIRLRVEISQPKRTGTTAIITLILSKLRLQRPAKELPLASISKLTSQVHSTIQAWPRRQTETQFGAAAWTKRTTTALARCRNSVIAKSKKSINSQPITPTTTRRTCKRPWSAASWTSRVLATFEYS